MDKPLKYRATDKMSDLICGNYALLLVMSRFGLSLGFGDKTVREVCSLHDVDTTTFLAVVNFMDQDCVPEGYAGEISIEALIAYLKQAHSYFLDFCLPSMRRKLTDAIADCTEDNVSFLILKFYDEYVDEVRKHMVYEDKIVFGYVEALLKGEKPGGYNITVFSKKHNQIELKLTELKNIIVKYYPVKGNNNLLNNVLFDIYSCEKDLAAHCRVEDYMFVPFIVRLEKKIADGKQ